MISNVIIHLINDLPIVADVEALPSGGDRVVHCTNVRTIDGKRPNFVHDRHSTFVFPLGVIRVIEAPPDGATGNVAQSADAPAGTAEGPPPAFDEEPDEDLLARIRQA